MEQALKIPIRNRKNAMFYKTEFGAEVAGFAQSLIFTAAQNDINPQDYLTMLLKNEDEVVKNPCAWLPWNYKDRLTPCLLRKIKIPPLKGSCSHFLKHTPISPSIPFRKSMGSKCRNRRCCGVIANMACDLRVWIKPHQRQTLEP